MILEKEQRAYENVTTRLEPNPFKVQGKAFIGWNELPNQEIETYQEQQEVTFDSDKKLYAVWKDPKPFLLGLRRNFDGIPVKLMYSEDEGAHWFECDFQNPCDFLHFGNSAIALNKENGVNHIYETTDGKNWIENNRNTVLENYVLKCLNTENGKYVFCVWGEVIRCKKTEDVGKENQDWQILRYDDDTGYIIGPETKIALVIRENFTLLVTKNTTDNEIKIYGTNSVFSENWELKKTYSTNEYDIEDTRTYNRKTFLFGKNSNIVLCTKDGETFDEITFPSSVKFLERLNKRYFMYGPYGAKITDDDLGEEPATWRDIQIPQVFDNWNDPKKHKVTEDTFYYSSRQNAGWTKDFENWMSADLDGSVFTFGGVVDVKNGIFMAGERNAGISKNGNSYTTPRNIVKSSDSYAFQKFSDEEWWDYNGLSTSIFTYNDRVGGLRYVESCHPQNGKEILTNVGNNYARSYNDNPTNIEESAFMDCCEMRVVGLDGKIKVSNRFFHEKTDNLAKVKLGEPVSEIETECFANCSSLTRADLPKTIEKIDEKAFANCSSLVEVCLSDHQEFVPVLENLNAFENCKKLNTIWTSDEKWLEWYGTEPWKQINYQLSSPTQSRARILAENRYTVLSNGIFNYRQDTQWIFPDIELKIIEEKETEKKFKLFGGWQYSNISGDIRSVITDFDCYPFFVDVERQYWYGSKMIFANMTSVDLQGLLNTNELNLRHAIANNWYSQYIKDPYPFEDDKINFYYTRQNKQKLWEYVYAKVDTPDYNLNWNSKDIQISGYFVGCQPLGGTYVEGKLAGLQSGALLADDNSIGILSCNSRNLTYVEQGVNCIGINFQNCKNLQEIKIDKDTIALDNCFDGCEKLENIQYASNNLTFMWKKSLGVENVNAIFRNCKKLLGSVEVQVSEDILVDDELPNETFENCEKLQSIDLTCNTRSILGIQNGYDDGIETYGAFANCHELRNITGLDYLEHIGVNAFYECRKLDMQWLYAANHLKTIGSGAFAGCISVGEKTITQPFHFNELILGGRVESIGHSAFARCQSIAKMFIHGTPTIGSGAFYNCTNLNYVKFDTTIDNFDKKYERNMDGTYSKLSHAFTNGIKMRCICKDGERLVEGTYDPRNA